MSWTWVLTRWSGRPKTIGDGDQRRRQQQDHQQQRRAQREQDDHRADEADQRRQEAGDRLGQHRPHERHVAGEARHELAHAALAVEVQRQGHQAPVELTPQLGHDPFAHDAQQPRLDEAGDRLDAEQRHQDDDEPIEAGRVASRDDLARDAGDQQGKTSPTADPTSRPTMATEKIARCGRR